MKKNRLRPKPSASEGGKRQRRVVELLRQSILDGTYGAGAKIPNQNDLAQQYQVSGFTIHRALNQLSKEGFIRKQLRLGTHVVENPPHLTNIGLLFASSPASTQPYNKWYKALENAAISYQQTMARNISRFHGIDSHTDTPDYHHLMDCLATHQLAGLIFAFPPSELAGSPILEMPGIPRVAMTAQHVFPNIPTVTSNLQSFINRALDYLLERGRKRIALLLAPGSTSGTFRQCLDEALSKRGLEIPSHWRQICSQLAPEGACNAVQLLLHDRPEARPDGLIVFDDNLVEEAQAGLIAAGVRVPNDIDVVEHCNFPWTKSVLATRRLGYDSNQVLRTCIDLIDRQRAGETVPNQTLIPAVFEDELK